jgi:LETM1 and EF-hand domain-containing protein 1
MIQAFQSSVKGSSLLRQSTMMANRNAVLFYTQQRFQSTKSEKEKPEQTETENLPQKAEKPPLMERIKHEIQHYWDGTKLLGYEVNISTKLLFKMLRGYELTRREQTQLSRTTGDLFRLVPFSAFIIIPFAELLLPIALKMFPNLLPSTYESKADKTKKKEQLMKTRAQTSSFLRQTFKESGLKLPKSTSDADKAEFIQFFKSLNTLGESPTKEQVVKIARLFKNDLVLDNLSRPQLVAMAKYMNLRPFGSDQILRYQIRYKLLQIIKDDRAIDYEGVESLSLSELQSACASRGIKTFGVSPARLKDDLNIWLDLRLRQKIPSTLLILSSVYTYGEASNNLDSYYDALVQVLRSIPDQVYNVTKSEVSEDDVKLRLELIKEQQELIREEQEQSEHRTVATPVKDDIKLEDFEKEEEVKKIEEPTDTPAAVEIPKDDAPAEVSADTEASASSKTAEDKQKS